MNIFAKKRILSLSVIAFALLLSHGTLFASDAKLWLAYRTDAEMSGGKTVYDKARFSWVYMGIKGLGKGNDGTFTIKKGKYTFGTFADRWSKGASSNVNGTDKEFTLAFVKGIMGTTGFSPVNAQWKELIFWGAAETGLSEKTVSYKLDAAQGEIALPKIRSTKAQLESYVPYIEYVLSGKDITGLIVRFVSIKDTQTPLTRGEAVDLAFLERVNIFGKHPEWKFLKGVRIDKFFRTGDTLEASVKVDPPVDSRKVGVVEVWFRDAAQTKGAEVWQRWNCYQD